MRNYFRHCDGSGSDDQATPKRSRFGESNPAKRLSSGQILIATLAMTIQLIEVF
jgi:hypothetical protein